GLVGELAGREVLELQVRAREGRHQELGELARLAAVLAAAGREDGADRRRVGENVGLDAGADQRDRAVAVHHHGGGAARITLVDRIRDDVTRAGLYIVKEILRDPDIEFFRRLALAPEDFLRRDDDAPDRVDLDQRA